MRGWSGGVGWKEGGEWHEKREWRWEEGVGRKGWWREQG